MTEAVPDQPDIAATLNQLMPRLRRAQIGGWALLILSLLICLWFAATLLTLPRGNEEAAQGLSYGLAIAFIGVILAPPLVRRWHEAAVMPALSRAVGLTYQAKARSLAESFPERLLPRDMRWEVDSLVTGEIASRAVRLVELKIITAGRPRRVLFKGIVMEMQNAVAMPSFFVALNSETESGLLRKARLDPTGLASVRFFSNFGNHYGVWAEDPDSAQQAGLDAVIDALVAAEADIGDNSSLYSAVCDGRTTWVAIRKDGDIFRVGGLFATRDGLLSQLQVAAGDFGLPLRLVNRLLQAEAIVAERSRLVEATGSA